MTDLILNIVLAVATVGVSILSYYLSVKKLIQEQALAAINYAETYGKELELLGEEKMAIAVDAVYDVLPAIAKAFVTKQMLEMTIQAVFDQVKAFAEKQVK